jgi:hypothetical protein
MFPEKQESEEIKQYPELPVADLAPKRKSSPLKRIVIIAVPLALLAMITFLLLDNHYKKPNPKTNQTTITTSHGVTNIDSSTKHYDSTNLFLGFSYPADWSVTEPDVGKLSAISPQLSIKSAGNQIIKARIVMTIQNAQSTISQFAGNTAVAPIESQKISYKSPSQGQRAQTYLTAVNYAGGVSTIDAFYITGDNGYMAEQYIPQSDVTKDDPLISISFFACADTTCSDYGKATSIATNAWADKSLSAPLITMLRSLQTQ